MRVSKWHQHQSLMGTARHSDNPSIERTEQNGTGHSSRRESPLRACWWDWKKRAEPFTRVEGSRGWIVGQAYIQGAERTDSQAQVDLKLLFKMACSSGFNSKDPLTRVIKFEYRIFLFQSYYQSGSNKRHEKNSIDHSIYLHLEFKWSQQRKDIFSQRHLHTPTAL